MRRFLCRIGRHDWVYCDNPYYPAPHHCARCGKLHPIFAVPLLYDRLMADHIAKRRRNAT